MKVRGLIYYREPSGGTVREGFALCYLDHAGWRLDVVKALHLPRAVAPIEKGFEVNYTR